jgi:2-polyprenyl-6-methoxyphenol hydroxylase-like FAD-dependent oxidoreductase
MLQYTTQTDTNSDPAVLIVGAGPVGLTLAAELARHGVHCRIVDKTLSPSTHSKALVIFPRTLEVFAQMGMLDPVLQAG